MSQSTKPYEKLFNSILLMEFPEISSLEIRSLRSITGVGGISVDFFLKSEDEISSMVSCDQLSRRLAKRIEELAPYIGPKMFFHINIHFEGEVLCQNWVRG